MVGGSVQAFQRVQLWLRRTGRAISNFNCVLLVLVYHQRGAAHEMCVADQARKNTAMKLCHFLESVIARVRYAESDDVFTVSTEWRIMVHL